MAVFLATLLLHQKQRVRVLWSIMEPGIAWGEECAGDGRGGEGVMAFPFRLLRTLADLQQMATVGMVCSLLLPDDLSPPPPSPSDQ